MNTLVLTFDDTGIGRCLYSELIDLAAIGLLEIQRASLVEFNEKTQRWEVRQPNGRLLFSHRSRAVCLAWEHHTLNH